ncbi:28S ribosomal protein s18c [Plakobranchus ocellatus]|uniref:28S ribosomal protein s18c n=1 Tax=Plakobranchus ocellatus TaxID=259542 RepID=A0AAV3XTU6_9GAST|nr:28S ribosomal protein s18c [Plakobranchus ocellatus]
MAALTSVCPLFGGLLSRQLMHVFKMNISLMFVKDSTFENTSQSSPPIATSFRKYQTSSPKNARFQRPPPLTINEVDWSKMQSLNSPYKHSFDPLLVERLLDQVDKDMPVSNMPDPFEKNYRRCFLCRHDVHLDHKNIRLLSQFVSPYTGRIYGRAITGLCIPMQKRVASLIKRARVSGYMPFLFKDPKYLHDPLPYDVMARKA